jgi:radical SAM superfamily enzyme YgiQ (UPF0313 family)
MVRGQADPATPHDANAGSTIGSEAAGIRERDVMRILLTLPFHPDHYITTPDLGLGYLASSLRDAGHDVRILITTMGMKEEAFQRLVEEGPFDVVGIKALSFELLEARNTIDIVRRLSRRTLVVVGGPGVSAQPNDIFDYLPKADYAVAGEGELVFNQLLACVEEERTGPEVLQGIPGLIWRNGETVQVNPVGPVPDVDVLPFPAWDLMEPRDFPLTPFNGYSRRFPIATMLLSRGCPYGCTFCGQGRAPLRPRKTDDIMAELRMLVEEHGVREIQFYDSNIIHPKTSIREVLQRIVDEKIDVLWNAPNGIRVDHLDPELAYLMKRSGCYQVNVGIESGSPRILKQVKKGIRVEQVRKSVRMLRDAGIEVVGFFIIGFPGESRTEIEETVDFALSLPITGGSFTILLPLPGSQIYDDVFGKEARPSIEELSQMTFAKYENNLSQLSSEEFHRVQKSASLRLHLRPTVLFHMIKNINHPQKLKLLTRRTVGVLRG